VATKTLGTLATTSLTAVQIPPKYNATPQISAADWATIMNSIYDTNRNPQQSLNQQPLADCFVRSGLLYVPNRGVLICNAGDWVAVDQSGWPVLIAKESLPQTLTATGNWSVAAGTAVTNLSANVLNQGWWAGMLITGTNIPTGTFIQAIAANGLSLTLTKAATGTQTGGTLTAGSWTHS
jgi:hypothetical protein